MPRAAVSVATDSPTVDAPVNTPPVICSADYNSEYDFPQYKLHGLMLQEPSLMLRNSTGGLVTVTGTYNDKGGEFVCDVFDFTNPKVSELFIQECMNATSTGYVDGCFVDYAVDGW